MTRNKRNGSAWSKAILLDRASRRREHFAALHPVIVSSLHGLRNSLIHASEDSLWISYEPTLTNSLLKAISWPSPSLGRAIFLHAISVDSVPALNTCFERIAFSADGGFLPPQELAEVLHAANRSDLFVGGSLDRAHQTLTLWRGNLEPLTIPFAAFNTSGDGLEPDFSDFSVIDYGHTIRLGEYEAAADAILYEFDRDYRRRIHKQRQESERSFGASLRRLRKQRGLRQQDFAPLVASKTIARIEQGKVRRIHPKTLKAIAQRLAVPAEEIAEY